jgi:hypothetical protein
MLVPESEQNCRIRLASTHYKEIPSIKLCATDFPLAEQIYLAYCEHKQFSPAAYNPVWLDQFTDQNVDVLGYFDQGVLVAFSIIYLFPQSKCVYGDQFAWDYNNTKLKLGYKSIRSECARYRRLGYKYYYLGEVTQYKKQLRGYEPVIRPQRERK